MDPLTHTLVGGSLAATRLGHTTRLATAALVIGANLPDIDVLAFVNGSDAALGFRRGWTHGVPALVVLPALLAAALLWWGRRRPSATGQTLSAGWLFALSYIAVLTHPALDWLNTYGMRWLMPFDGTWFYGDSVYIVDPWLWLILGAGWLVGRKPTWRVALLVLLPGVLLLIRVIRRAPGYAPVIVLVLLALLAVLYWQPKYAPAAHIGASIGLATATIFIVAMISLHSMTVARVEDGLEAKGLAPVQGLMVGPMPTNPLAWDVVLVHEERIRTAVFTWADGGVLRLSEFNQLHAPSGPEWDRIETGGAVGDAVGGEVGGFLGWARFPWIEVDASQGELYLMDARYTRHRTLGFGGASVALDERLD